MSRVERFGNATLYLGDCREILPTLPPVDAIVTDPPYGIGAGTGIGKITKEGSDFTDALQWDDKPPKKEIFDQLRNISKEQIFWGGNYFELPPTSTFIVWDKVQPEDFTLAMAEIAWANIEYPAKLFRWKSMSINDGQPKFHPTQKPLELMQFCLRYIKGRTILDPYMGSGTTGVAAHNMGKSFIGIEKHEPYFDIAARRIEQASKQDSLF